MLNYNGHVTNPVPIVSLVNPQCGATYVLQLADDGFKLFMFTPDQEPAYYDFNFIVTQIG